MEQIVWFVGKLGSFLYKTYILNAPALLTGFAIAVGMALLACSWRWPSWASIVREYAGSCWLGQNRRSATLSIY